MPTVISGSLSWRLLFAPMLPTDRNAEVDRRGGCSATADRHVDSMCTLYITIMNLPFVIHQVRAQFPCHIAAIRSRRGAGRSRGASRDIGADQKLGPKQAPIFREKFMIAPSSTATSCPPSYACLPFRNPLPPSEHTTPIPSISIARV